MNGDDYERLAPHAYLEREWAELLRDMAARVGVSLYEGEPRVTMVPRTAFRAARSR